MGVDITTNIYKKNDDGSYTELKLYRLCDNGSYKEVLKNASYNTRDYVLFDMLTNGNDDIPTAIKGVWPNLPQTDCPEVLNYYNHSWFTWSELMLMSKLSNRIERWVDSINFVLECCDIYSPKSDDIVVTIKFDC